MTSLGLRELARAADLNPNTFYRHFDDLDDLGRTIAVRVQRSLMDDLRLVRSRAREEVDVTRAVVEHYVDAVVADPDPYRIGLHELHGPSPAMRAVLEQLLDDLADESVEQLVEAGLDGGLPSEVLAGLTRHITRTMFFAAGDLVATPSRRDEVADRLVEIITWAFTGAMTTASS